MRESWATRTVRYRCDLELIAKNISVRYNNSLPPERPDRIDAYIGSRDEKRYLWQLGLGRAEHGDNVLMFDQFS